MCFCSLPQIYRVPGALWESDSTRGALALQESFSWVWSHSQESHVRKYLSCYILFLMQTYIHCHYCALHNLCPLLKSQWTLFFKNPSFKTSVSLNMSFCTVELRPELYWQTLEGLLGGGYLFHISAHKYHHILDRSGGAELRWISNQYSKNLKAFSPWLML